MSKTSRRIRAREFNKHVLEGLKMTYNVESGKNGNYIVETKEHGTIDIYPMADKVLFRNENKWIKDGIEWVCNNL